MVPEFFSGLAVDVLCSHFPDDAHGASSIDAVTSLARAVNAVLPVALAAARECLRSGHNADDAARLLGVHVQLGGTLDDADLDAVLAAQSYRFHWRFHDGRHDYVGCGFAMEQAYTITPYKVTQVFERRLRTDDKHVRVDTLHALNILLTDRTELGWVLVPALIDGLELADDSYEESADGMTCEVLARLYRRQPLRLQSVFEDALPTLSGDARVELLGVHDRVVRHPASEPDGDGPVAVQAVQSAAQFLLSVVCADDEPLELRSKAALTLRGNAGNLAEALAGRLEVVVATLALCVQKRAEAASAHAPLLAALQRQEDDSALALVQQGLAAVLGAVAHVAPEKVLDQLDAITSNLDSRDPAGAALKAELTTLYGILGEQRSLTPRVIPPLYRLLLDSDSVRVRATAVSSVARIFERHPDSVPQDMTDLLVAYLSDSYVMVCQRAAAAMIVLPVPDDEMALEIFRRLCALNVAFVKDGSRSLRNLREPLFRFAGLLPGVTDQAIGQILELHAQHEARYVAGDALRDFSRYYTPASASSYVRVALEFLERSPPDHFNTRSIRDDDVFRGLQGAPRDVLAAHADDTRRVATRYAATYELARFAIEFTELFVHAELFHDAARLAADVVLAQPEGQRQARLRRRALMVCATCQTEAYISQGRADLALDAADDAARLARQEEDEHYLNDTETHTLARRILDRTREL